MSSVLYNSDYLKVYESNLDNHFYKFEIKCDNFQSCWNEANKIFQKNFNECDCDNVGINEENSMRDNCMKKLREISNLTKLRDDLQSQIKKEILKDDDSKPIDTELIGLPLKHQNFILANRILNLEYSKHMATKVIEELLREAKIAEEKELNANIEMRTQENSFKTLNAQQKSIEDEINAEVQRLKNSFVKIYDEKLFYKLKYDEIEQKIRLDLNIKEAKLRADLMANKLDIEKTNKAIEVQKKLLKEEQLLDMEFSEQCESLVIKSI